MADTTRRIDSDPATVALYEVAKQVDALSAAWQGDDLPPDLAQFLPAKPVALRRLVLNELIKVDLEYRWLHHELPKQVEEYVGEFPDVAPNGELPCDLIYEEFHIRGQTEAPVAADEYYRRFPRQAERLRRMMSMDESKMGSTTLVGSQRDTSNIDVGQQIDDFDLLVKLGKGSFGSVYLARQRSMQRLVALKISRDRGVEPQTLAQLDHPNIVRVYDQRVLVDRKLQLMYMQHIPGGTLQEALEGVREKLPQQRTGKIVLDAIDRSLDRHGDSPPAESSTRRRLAAASWPEVVCWIGARLAAALEYAHRRGVLHRDIKPANVLLTAEGSPKLVDFNVSFSSKLEGSTPAAYFGGSLIYMSPEQIEAYNPDHSRAPDELDGRSDVYSLGIVLWELLTGSRPFSSAELEDCINDTPKLLTRLAKQRQAGLKPEILATLPTNLPPGLKEVLLSCLSPNVADRPATAGALARRLDLCLQPRAQDLLHPPPNSNRHLLRRWPVSTFVPIGLTPSIILSIFNLQINRSEIINPTVLDFFDKVEVRIINGVMFSIAIFLVVRFAWPVMKLLRQSAARKEVNAVALPAARRRALWIGDFAGWLSMALWIITGMAFPTWLNLHFGDIEGAQFHEFSSFLASQIACGGISSTITFFLLNLIMVHVFYPVLVRPEQAAVEEVQGLLRLEWRCAVCFYLTVAAPFVALALELALVISSQSSSGMKMWMTSLIVIGAASCVASFKLLQVIRADIAALTVALDPQHDAGSIGSDTGNSFWTDSR